MTPHIRYWLRSRLTWMALWQTADMSIRSRCVQGIRRAESMLRMHGHQTVTMEVE